MFSNYINRRVSLLLIVFLPLFIQSCGGDKKKAVAPVNPISITLSGVVEIQEGEAVTITATAAAATKFAWSIDNSAVVLSGSDSASVTFTAPDVDIDTPVVLTLTASDGNGNSKSASHTITILRNVSTITISGLVTDNFIANASLEVMVADELFRAQADDKGIYTVDLAIDENSVNQLVKIVAKGDTSINAGVEFVSLLPSFSTLKQQAGSDGELNKDDNFGVNITNVTTAEFVLVNRENSGEAITTEEQLIALIAMVDTDEKLKLAAVIKVVVDNPNFSLPEGIESTLALIESQQSTEDFISVVEAEAPGTIDDAVNEIKDDDTLVDQIAPITSGAFILTNLQSYRSTSDHFTFNTDGTGTISTGSIKQADITWAQQDKVITISPVTALIQSVAFCNDEINDGQYECQTVISSITLEVFNQAGEHYDVEATYVNVTSDIAGVVADITDTSTFISNLLNKSATLVFDSNVMAGQWHIGSFFWSIDDQGIHNSEIGADLDLLADGTGTATIEASSYNVTWSVNNNELTLSLANYSYIDENDLSVKTGLVNRYWLVKNKEAFLQTSLSREDTSVTSSMWVKVQDDAMFDLTNTIGRWTLHNDESDEIFYHFDIFDDNIMQGSWGSDYSWTLENGHFIRARETCRNNINDVEECFDSYRMDYRLIATVGGRQYTRRTYATYDYDNWYNTGELTYDLVSDYIFVQQHSTEIVENRFEKYQLESATFYSVNGVSDAAGLEEHNFAEIEEPLNSGNFISVMNSNDYYNSSDSWQSKYNLIAGKIVGEDINNPDDNFVIEMTSYTRDYIGTCIYAQGSTCATNGEEYRFYFWSKLAEAEAYYNVLKAQVNPIPNTSAIVGAWQFANNTTTAIVFTDDGHYVHMEKASVEDEADPNCSSGFEVGTYSWNESTTEFGIDNIKDTNGCIGLWDSTDSNANKTYNTLTVSGDVLTLNITEDGVAEDVVLNRVISSTDSFVGAFYEGDLDNDFWLHVAFDDTNFMELGNDVAGNEVGVNISTYSLDIASSLLNMANDATLILNQLNTVYDENVLKVYGDILIWKDGEGGGVMKRVGTSNPDQVYMTEQDVVGTFDLVDQISPNDVIQIRFNSDFTFDVLANSGAIPTGEFTWELQFGQVVMLLDPDPNVDEDEEMDIWMPVNISNSPWSMNVAFFELFSAPDDNETGSYGLTTGTWTKQ